MTFCDMPQFYAERRVTARRPHKCCECHIGIAPGVVYVRIAGKWEGHFNTYVQHVECRDFAAKVNRHIGECTVAFGYVEDAMVSPQEYGIEIPDAVNFADEWRRIKDGQRAAHPPERA